MEFSNYDIANMFCKSELRPVQRLRQAYYVALRNENPTQTAWHQPGS
jgi:hypothetical protein